MDDDGLIVQAKEYLKNHVLKDVFGEGVIWANVFKNNEKIYKIFSPIQLNYDKDKRRVIVKCKPSSGFYEDEILFIWDENDPIPQYIEFFPKVIFVDNKFNVLEHVV